MLENSIVMVAIILAINIVYVSFFTIRMILTLKGQRYLAAMLSSIEVIIYVVGLGVYCKIEVQRFAENLCRT